MGGARLAFSTDSFVVRPLFFPGGSIGDLAVNGTVNDLAMSGAHALFLSAAFILEEGTEVTKVGAVAERLGAAAERAGVRVVTGDTKVVESGHGDGVYVNTAGVGVVPAGVDIRPDKARPGDVVIVSGDIGVHGVAIMSVREGLQFGADIESDCQPLNGLVATMLATGADIHVLRDPTRGGVATSLNEIASASGVGVRLSERSLPIPEVVANACAFLGLDPLQVANEGKLLAFVPSAAGGRRARSHAVAPGRGGGHGHRRVRGGPPRHGVHGHRLRGLAGRRPAHRRTAPADLLMKFLVLWNLEQSLLSDSMVRSIARMPEYGGRLEEQGKVLMRYHIVGAHGGAWIYDVESHEEFERLLAVAPVFNFSKYHVYPLADMTGSQP